MCVALAYWVPQESNCDLKIDFIKEYSWDKWYGREFTKNRIIQRKLNRNAVSVEALANP